MLESKATFLEMPQDKKKGYKETGNPEKGKQVFNQSCQVCHDKNGPSHVELDNTRAVARSFIKGIAKKNSLYDYVRNGTYPYNGHKPYMPLYPKERMSNQQVEDLRAYFESRFK